ncbi:hypothetical protein DY000_02030683 [Brassica cretica]|uniref:Uncharacterized protein n=1 Tax=Brassica cretica TaxID=69181 RepID=A0ABQ7DWT1_BRACR|nr:hypothetical protein DY000_02030683 [Brassica cretica]
MSARRDVLWTSYQDRNQWREAVLDDNDLTTHEEWMLVYVIAMNIGRAFLVRDELTNGFKLGLQSLNLESLENPFLDI